MTASIPPTTARIRGVLAKALLDAVRGGDEPRKILDRVQPAHLSEIDAALPIAYVSMEAHMDLSEAVRNVLGPEESVRIWTRVMDAAFARPILRGFTRMTLDLFSGGPGALLKQGSRVYALLTQRLGTLHPRTDEEGWEERRTLDVVLRGFPAETYRFITYVEGLQGCQLAALHVGGGGESSAVDVVEIDETAGVVRYRTSW